VFQQCYPGKHCLISQLLAGAFRSMKEIKAKCSNKEQVEKQEVHIIKTPKIDHNLKDVKVNVNTLKHVSLANHHVLEVTPQVSVILNNVLSMRDHHFFYMKNLQFSKVNILEVQVPKPQVLDIKTLEVQVSEVHVLDIQVSKVRISNIQVLEVHILVIK
jgi:hypothetical protein